MQIILKKLFNTFEKRGIPYVIWKSLEVLEQALAGKGDLDVLFSNDRKEEVQQILFGYNFTIDWGSPVTYDDDLIEFRGFDKRSLTFSAIHAHFRCRFGSKKYKEFIFPFENEMLTNTKKYKGIRILNDDYFIITRIIHTAVKKNYKDNYVSELAKKYKKLSSLEKNNVEIHLSNYFNTDIKVLLKDLEKGNLKILDKYYLQVCRYLDEQNSIDNIIQRVKKYPSKISFRQNYFPNLLKYRRNKFDYPMEVLLAGHDGTGKTTISTLVTKKINALSYSKRIYLGRNKWSRINDFIDKKRGKNNLYFFNYIWPITSTLEILFRIIKGKIYKFFGAIIIYDRSIIDLKIKYKNKSLLLSWFPLLVSKIFNNDKADLKFFFIADPSIVIDRKGKHSTKEILQIQDVYLKNIDESYKIIDTSKRTIKEIAGLIIEEIFNLIASKHEKI